MYTINNFLEIEFYKKYYQDIRNKDDEFIINHFNKYGIFEGRVGNSEFLKKKLNYNINLINKQNKIIDNYKFIKKENLINIIIRTSNRENCFEINIKSISYQNYKNLKLHISYDNEETLNYINKTLKNYDFDFLLYEMKKKKNQYYYNGYCNILLNNINNGYIIFLDDDDKFICNNSLKYINEFLDENYIIYWNYLRTDKIIKLFKNKLQLGNIANCCFCYNSKYKSLWKEVKSSDYYFLEKLMIDNNLELYKINKVLTSIINTDFIYGEGKCIDIKIN